MVLPDDSGVTGASLGVDNLRDEVCRQALRSNRVLISGIPLKLFVYVITKLTKQSRYSNFQRVGHFFYISNLSFVSYDNNKLRIDNKYRISIFFEDNIIIYNNILNFIRV